MGSDLRERSPRVSFDQGFKARIIAIDGTWTRDCQVLEISTSGASLQIDCAIPEIKEFFLALTTVGKPVYRRCKVAWAEGARIGTMFIVNELVLK